jgi:hypothetical protein
MIPAQLYLNLVCNNIESLGESKDDIERVIDELILPEIKQQLLEKYQIYSHGGKGITLAGDNIELNAKDITLQTNVYIGD